MPHSGFVPLRIFSSYTMLDGAIEPKAIAARAKALGFPAAALTDRNGLYAAMAFSDAAKKGGVQPVIGTMLGVARGDMPDGAAPVLDWIALYAQDKAGYDNLCALVSMAHLDRPIEQAAPVDLDALAGHTDGLIALTAGGEGALARLFAEDQPARAAAYCDRLQALFPDRLYIELSRRGDAVETRQRRRWSTSLTIAGCRWSRPIPVASPRRISARPTMPCCASRIRPMSKARIARAARPTPGSSPPRR